MCGIGGAFCFQTARRSVDAAELRAIREAMADRGPDGAGDWISPTGEVGLVHRRLSIIDLSERGAQPMLSADRTLAVTFNGEIYNYQALRAELERDGCVFASHSDTEVLLHLYARHGEDMVSRLRGMFAFAIWDERRRRLFLARDPYGIKPLYYSTHGETFRFASSVSALLAGGGVPRERSAAGWVGFFLLGSVPEPFTTTRNVRCLPAGTMLTVSADGATQMRRHHSIAEVYARAEVEALRLSPSDLEERVRASLIDSVRHHLVADVPVGVFLSAGVDSGALVGLMRECGPQSLQAITLAFREFEGTAMDEAPLAATVAARYGASHRVRRVGAQEFADDLPSIFAHMDQPSIDGLNTWFVSKAARECGLKVAMSGLGGDELLGGYSTFTRLPAWLKQTRPFARALRGADPFFRAGVEALQRLGVKLHPKAAGLLRYGRTLPDLYLLQRSLFLPSDIESALGDPRFVAQGLEELDAPGLIADALTPTPRTDFATIATLESSLYLRNQLLRDADWAGMAHGVEIRTPLVDHVLLAHMAPLMLQPDRPAGKTLLMRAPRPPLPADIAERAKTGFSIPVAAWRETLGGSFKAAPSNLPEAAWARPWALYVGAAMRARAAA